MSSLCRQQILGDLYSLKDIMIAEYGQLLLRIAIVVRDLENFEAAFLQNHILEQVAAVLGTELPQYRNMMEVVVSNLRQFDLPQSTRLADSVLRNWNEVGAQKLFNERVCLHLRQTFDSEISGIWFKAVSKEGAELYLSKEPWGPGVAAAFPRCIVDVEEAGKCLALGRTTASVFHLMRVMEHGVQQLAKKLKIVGVASKNWQPLLDEINKAIKSMPERPERLKAKKEKYSEVAAHLHSVKMAWRNPVMHPRSTYSEEQAKEIYGATRIFMVALANLIGKVR